MRSRRLRIGWVGLALLALLSSAVFAKGRYLSLEDFLSSAFPGDKPQMQTLWLTGELKKRAETVLGHKPRGLRLRYWSSGERRAWVLDEIGKELPITMGVVTEGDRIDSLRILEFREVRGEEVKLPWFTRQFDGASLARADKLDRPIDGISGATYSVRAVKKVARLALLYARAVQAQSAGSDTGSP